MRKKGLTIFLIVLVILFFGLLAGYVAYDKYMDSRTMGCKISIMEEDVSWKTVEETAQLFEDNFIEREIVFRENGEEIYRTKLSEAGYTLNDASLKEELTAIKESRKQCLVFFERQKEYTIQHEVSKDEAKLKKVVSADHFGGNDSREQAKDAYIAYDEEAKTFSVVDSQKGTQIDEAALLAKTEKIVTEAVSETMTGDPIEIPIDDSCYLDAAVTADQAELQQQAAALNDQLKRYETAVVNYTFGSTVESIDRDTLASWIKVDGLEVSLDQEAIKTYVASLAEKYNTLYLPRKFKTTAGEEITVTQNEHGYRIDQEAEVNQLIADLESGEEVSRAPVYSKAGYKREGMDDLAGSYVELSIEKQHLWLYVDGQLITETDVVTGLPTEDRATLKGAYSIAYKTSPFTLTSETYGYESEVTYWMPFVLGQGLHDASWKSSFGGEIYKSSGSHGCVNLPEDQAAIIYEHVDAGFPIIIY